MTRDEGTRFEIDLAMYQARLYEEAREARKRSWEVAARPLAAREESTFGRLRPGDFMTSDGVRWVRVVELRGPSCNVKRRARNPELDFGEVSVLFEIPEPVSVSGETRYWIERNLHDTVTIDANARRE